MTASRLLRAAAMAAAAYSLLLGTSSAAAQTAAGSRPPDGPPLISDGIDTGAVQTLTGRSRFSVGQHGPSMDHLPAVRENVELISKLEMNTPPEYRFDPQTGLPDPTEPPVVPGQIADLAVYKNFAYLNSWSEPSCKRGGIFVVDISDPKNPQQVAFRPAGPNTRHGEGAHVITIGGMDVLAVNNEPLPPPCDQTLPSEGGIDLWNVTNPRNAQLLARGVGDRSDPNDLPGDPGPVHPVHSTFLWKDDTGRAFAVMTDNDEFGMFDVDILEITNPAAPQLIAEHNLTALFDIEDTGALSNLMYHHDVVVKKIDGVWTMLVSYWDAGYVTLDVNDPANPKYIGDTSFDGPDPLTGWDPPEGNAHQAEFSHDNRYILAADEDFDTHRFITRIDGEPMEFAVGIPVTPPPNVQPRFDLLPTQDEPIEGDTRFIGDGCVAATVPPPQGEERVAVAERGTCDFDLKAANASAAGYDAILIFNNVLGPAPRCDAVNLNMIFDDPNADIPALLVPRSIGFRIIDAYDPATYRCVQNDPTSTPTPAPNRAGVEVFIGFEYDGWGYTHLYERSAGKMRHVGAFAIEEGLDERYATGFGDLTVHEFATDPTENVAYSSYYAGGMRVFTFGEGGLTQTGKFIDQGGNNFWGVEWFNGPGDRERLAAFSDRDFGLYILRYTGPGAATAPLCEDVLASTHPNQPVTVPLRCTDPNTGNVVTRAIVSGPSNGTVAAQGDRAVYTPGRGFKGEDRFTFRASDGSLVSNVATARIVVGAGRCANLRTGTAASERLTGTEFGDTIVGYAGDDVIDGLGGRDCISGKRGNDRLAGGKGGDTVDGQAGADRIRGGNARDTVRGGPGADRVSGGRGADMVQGDAGSDRLRGGRRRDVLTGGVGRDNIDGGRGRDSIEADAGADRIFARDGARDSIDCGRGRDTVVTRDRVDELTGCEVRGRPGR